MISFNIDLKKSKCNKELKIWEWNVLRFEKILFSFSIQTSHLDLPDSFFKGKLQTGPQGSFFGAEPHLPRHLEGLKSGFNWAVRTGIVPSWDILIILNVEIRSSLNLFFWRQVSTCFTLQVLKKSHLNLVQLVFTNNNGRDQRK